MESDLHHRKNSHVNQPFNPPVTRYRSAPSSYFANFLDNIDCEDLLNSRPPSPETERFFSRFMSIGNNEASSAQNPQPTESNTNAQAQFMASMKHEAEITEASQMVYQESTQSPLSNHGYSASISAMETSYRVETSTDMDRLSHMRLGDGQASNLVRHSSSPAELFSQIDIDNGYVSMGGIRIFNTGNSNNAEPSSSRMKNQITYSMGLPSSPGLVSPVSKIRSKTMVQKSSGDTTVGFTTGSWDDSAIMSDNFARIKRTRDDDTNTFSGLCASEIQNEAGNRPSNLLCHHLSLPKPSTEILPMEKLLQFQDSVPCKIRAKRGCATHPRSIAERVRRTRISERMRKLQELVPNMDKQTNTADMLDLAVDYIKDLQIQVKVLSDSRAKCTCSSKENQ